jgi:hypothetical protein
MLWQGETDLAAGQVTFWAELPRRQKGLALMAGKGFDLFINGRFRKSNETDQHYLRIILRDGNLRAD